MVYEYSWSYPYAVSAAKVGAHFEKLEAKYGAVTKENFLDSARSTKSEMHKLFEWDDKKAAEQHRLHQANMIINSLRVTIIENEETEPITVSAFVNTSKRKDKTYIHIVRAMGDQETSAAVLNDALRELSFFREKYKNLSELSGIIKAIDSLLAS